MKLTELKRYFRNKYVMRMIAGALIITMAGTGVTATVYGADKSKTQQELAEELNSYLETEEKEADKEETVYVITDSQGNATETIVSEHLLNTEKQAVLEDVTTLENVENVKGEETFTQNGNKLTWKADGNEIYYQGTTDKEVPVTQKLTYYLDGKEISPEKLAGQSGKVTIRFDYTNQEKMKVTIDGKQKEVCVPFAAVTGVILDDSFTNVEVTNGKVVSDGNNQLVVGYALPGLQESLQTDLDMELPEYFEMTAQVEDFSLETTMTVVMNAADLMDGEGEDALVSLDEMVHTLGDAADKLQDGTQQLADGAPALVSGVGELKAGTDEAASGSKDLASGARQVSDGVNELVATIQNMSTMLESNKQGVYTNFTNASGMSYEVASEAIASLQQLQTAMETGITYEQQAAAVLENGGTTADPSYQQAKAAAAQYYQAGAAGGFAVTNASEAAAAIVSIGNTIASLQNGMGQVDGAVNALEQVQAALSGGDTTQKLAALTKGAADVADGAEQLDSGLGKLQSGVTELNTKAGALGSGAVELNAGMTKLADGSVTLLSGNDKLKAIIDAGKEYQSYAGKADEAVGSVKFIYKTAAIKSE